jgi:hypothetical protein
MERSEGVTVTLARIMKLMDRSNERLLSSIGHFGSRTKLEQVQRLPHLLPVSASTPEPSPASVVVFQ